jgi:DNA-binding response OmpR family regulator
MAHTILLADDSVTIRKVVELTFSDTDIRVETASTGREALERFQTLHPDLVLADVIMPPPSGYDLCRAVKASDHPVPVLLLAGTFEPFDEQQALECRADGHLVKPFESAYLVERVSSLLAEPPPSPQVVEPEEEEEAETLLDDMLDEEPAVPEPSAEAREVPPAAEDRPERSDREAIIEAVLAKLSDEVVREIAWEVVPDLAEKLIRERIRQLEREDLPTGSR